MRNRVPHVAMLQRPFLNLDGKVGDIEPLGFLHDHLFIFGQRCEIIRPQVVGDVRFAPP